MVTQKGAAKIMAKSRKGGRRHGGGLADKTKGVSDEDVADGGGAPGEDEELMNPCDNAAVMSI